MGHEYKGHDIPKFLWSIIETPQFERLKNIHQYGLIYLFKEEANRTRYDHSIMVCVFAEKMLAALEKNSIGKKLPLFYRNAVLVAALLHDIGHGPYSHTWERLCDKKFCHEKNSSTLIDSIFAMDNVEVDWMTFENYDKPDAIKLIKDLITGDSDDFLDNEFLFLFEIVNNKLCGLDVDKWEYLTNDAEYTGLLQPGEEKNFEDIYLNAQVSEDRRHIEYRFRDYDKICELYKTRYESHVHFYQDPLWVCLEQILKRIFSDSEDKILINSKKIRDIRSEDGDDFLMLTDDSVREKIINLDGNTETLRHLIRCFRDPKECLHPEIPEEKALVPEYLIVKVKLDKPGEAMRGKDIRFYGNESEKPRVHVEEGWYHDLSYFKIKEAD